ncbi:UNVERIFIED_CONTAM: hypothetical protein Slati_4399700, partial [Sesamum latifolium]
KNSLSEKGEKPSRSVPALRRSNGHTGGRAIALAPLPASERAHLLCVRELCEVVQITARKVTGGRPGRS